VIAAATWTALMTGAARAPDIPLVGLLADAL